MSVADTSTRKFGKQIQKRQLEVPEYAASFVNYKALKKVTRIAPLISKAGCLVLYAGQSLVSVLLEASENAPGHYSWVALVV